MLTESEINGMDIRDMTQIEMEEDLVENKNAKVWKIAIWNIRNVNGNESELGYKFEENGNQKYWE